MRKIHGKDWKETILDLFLKEQYRQLLHASLKTLENVWLKNSPGNLSLIPGTSSDPLKNLTIADISAACELAQAWVMANDEIQLETKYPLAHKWLTFVLNIKGVKEAHDAYLKKNRLSSSA